MFTTNTRRTVMMTSVAWIACLRFSGGIVLAEDFPYPAVILSATASHSGPGSHYYETSKLNQGQRVEVYRKQGNWLAIRPPQDSFSWIASADLQTTAVDDVMVARRDGVRVWIGTTVVTLNKHHFQVELKQGESVAVIGEKRLVAPSGAIADTWYKVSPPSGEFRWVPEHAARRDEGGGLKSIGDTASQMATDAKAVSETLTEPPEFQRISDSTPPSPRNADPMTGTAAATDEGKPAAVELPPNPEWLSWQPPSDSIEFDRVLESFNTAVTTMVALPAKQWDFTEFRIKAAKMADGGPSALHRGKARKLQASIAEFERLAKRLSAPATAAGTGAGATSATVVGADEDGGNQRSGEGWLMPVHSSNKTVPKYTIVNDQGRFLQFVSPAPGVNLRRYEKQLVRVVGPSSYIPALDMPHITAQRVVQLR